MHNASYASEQMGIRNTVARSRNVAATFDLTLGRLSWVYNINMQFVPHREECTQLSRNRRWKATHSVLLSQNRCHRNATMHSSVTYHCQQCNFGDFMLPATIKRTCSSCKLPRYFCPILRKFGLSRISLTSPIPNFTKNPTRGRRADTCGQTEWTRQRSQALFATIWERA